MLDLAGPGELPTRAEVEEEGPPPGSQPEAPNTEVVAVPVPIGAVPGNPHVMENAPPASEQHQPEMEVSPAVSEAVEEDSPMPDAFDIPVPEEGEDDDLLFGDTECFLVHPGREQVWEIGVHETAVDASNLPSPEQALHFVFLATQERKKRVEVKLRDLTEEDRQKFKGAKAKEVGAWLDHGTVKKVAAGTLDESQLMRCRWILTWKNPETEGGPKRPKARLVVLGFEDPDLATIPNDAPTLGKDARQLLLQKVASNRWKLINFDISTAFLQGKGDGRKLGIHLQRSSKRH